MKFSVVIATYNRCGCLRRTLPTVLDQCFPPEEYEVIVVVDGSTDGTAQFLPQLKPKCAFRVIEQTNRGQAAAINFGIRHARGERLLFLDDDILCPPDLLTAHSEAFVDAVHQLVFGPVLVATDSPSGLATDWARTFCDEFFATITPEQTEEGWFRCVGSANSSAPLNILREAGGLDERLWRGNDMELGWRLWKSGFRFSYQPAARVRQIFEKSVDEIVADARDEGRGQVLLCRKHPELRTRSSLTSLLRKPLLSRAARHLTMRSPVPPRPFLDILLRAAGLLRPFPRGRRLALKLLPAQTTAETLRGAVRECGSWRSFHREFLVRVPILMYHNIGTHWPGGDVNLTISPRTFQRHVRWLSAHGFHAVSSAELAAFYTEGKALPEKPVLLTFDDAYEELAAHALPVLQKYGLKGTVFVVTSQIGGTNEWDQAAGWSRKGLMKAEDIREWSQLGIDFQCHSRAHPDLTALSESQIMDELTTSRARLEQLVNKPVASFAYPYGYYNTLARECVRQVFSLGFSCEEGLADVRADPHMLPRVNMLPQYGWFSPCFEVSWGYNPVLRFRTQLGTLYRALVRTLPQSCAGLDRFVRKVAEKLGHRSNPPLGKAADD